MISPTPTRRLIRAVTVSLAAAALLAGCSATASSTSTGSGAGAASKDAWTTISTSVRTASTGASVTDVLAANDAVAAVTTPADEAGTYDSGATKPWVWSESSEDLMPSPPAVTLRVPPVTAT